MPTKEKKYSGPTVKDAFEKSLTGEVVIEVYPYNGMSLHIKDIKVLVGKKNVFNVHFAELEEGIPNVKAGDDPANFNPVMISGTHPLSNPERSKITIGVDADDEDAKALEESERRHKAGLKRAEIDAVKATAKVDEKAAVKRAVAEALKKEREINASATADTAKDAAAVLALAESATKSSAAVKTKPQKK